MTAEEIESYFEFCRLPKIIRNRGEKSLKSSEQRRRLTSRLNRNLEGGGGIRSVCSAHCMTGFSRFLCEFMTW